MKLTLTPTTIIEPVKGVLCRRWDGQTGKGTDVVCWIAVVAARSKHGDELDIELKEVVVDTRLVSRDMVGAL